jgi:hypothetical protein
MQKISDQKLSIPVIESKMSDLHKLHDFLSIEDVEKFYLAASKIDGAVRTIGTTRARLLEIGLTPEYCMLFRGPDVTPSEDEIRSFYKICTYVLAKQTRSAEKERYLVPDTTIVHLAGKYELHGNTVYMFVDLLSQELGHGASSFLKNIHDVRTSKINLPFIYLDTDNTTKTASRNQE